MKNVRKPFHFLFLVVVALLLTPLPSFADEEFEVDPFQFGLGTLATWARDAGEPGQTGEQFGLYLQKATATANLAAAQAEIREITPMPAVDLDVLAFDIPGRVGTTASSTTFGVSNGYCAAGSPRFVVNSGAGTCFLGCVHGDKTHDAVTGWWEIKFVEPFTQYPGCGGGVSGTVDRIRIVFDDGIDLGPGNVILDNIRVNDELVGEPNGD